MDPSQQLAKAASQLGKVAEFFGRRRLWKIPPSHRQAAVELHQIAAELAGKLAESARPGSAGHTASAILPAQVIDGPRVEGIARYLKELAIWVDAVKERGITPPPELAVAASRLERYLRTLLEENRILKPDASDLAGEELVLRHTDEEPALVGEGAKVRLSERARNLIAAFFASRGLKLDHRLEREVTRWLEATPPGHELVIKWSTLYESPKPYAHYRPIGSSRSEGEEGEKGEE